MSTEALRQQPANTSYLDTYGWILYRLNRFEEAKTYVQKAIDLGSKSAAIFEHMGDIWLKLSDKDKALDFWKKALELDSTNTGLREKIQRGNL
jgi:Tfp pilus assembly protein PilF